MSFQKLKRKVYLSLPRALQKKTKSLYYDGIIYPIYSLKYLINYGFLDFFDSIALETTTHCNLRCKFCPNSKYERGLEKNKKLMKTSLFKKIIDELSEIGYKGQILLHFYGEPLTDKRLPELVKYTRKNLPNADIQVNTNGFLLTIPIYKKLIEAGVDNFFITQYGKTKPPAIMKLFDYLKEHPKENKTEYRELGADLALSNRGGEIKVEKTVDYDRPICIYPNTAVHVNYKGEMVLCCNDYHSTITFGNITNEKLLTIWNKPFYKKLRKELRKKIFRLPICKKCVGIKQ